jgi:hypothetical protein
MKMVEHDNNKKLHKLYSLPDINEVIGWME